LCLSYAQVAAGYVDVHPGPFSTPKAYAFNEEDVKRGQMEILYWTLTVKNAYISSISNNEGGKLEPQAL
uniref:Chitinase n=1 Tax=Heligmosomoides polygyrus TaxID=6339 RepID=A0A183GUL7_HELPZ